jgi:hypothetical protein
MNPYEPEWLRIPGEFAPGQRPLPANELSLFMKVPKHNRSYSDNPPPEDAEVSLKFD